MCVYLIMIHLDWEHGTDLLSQPIYRERERDKEGEDGETQRAYTLLCTCECALHICKQSYMQYKMYCMDAYNRVEKSEWKKKQQRIRMVYRATEKILNMTKQQ